MICFWCRCHCQQISSSFYLSWSHHEAYWKFFVDFVTNHCSQFHHCYNWCCPYRYFHHRHYDNMINSRGVFFWLRWWWLHGFHGSTATIGQFSLLRSLQQSLFHWQKHNYLVIMRVWIRFLQSIAQQMWICAFHHLTCAGWNGNWVWVNALATSLQLFLWASDEQDLFEAQWVFFYRFWTNQKDNSRKYLMFISLGLCGGKSF